MVKDQHPHAVKEATAQVLPVWLEAFKVLLNLDPRQDVSNDDWDGLTVRIQIFKVRCYLHCCIFRPHWISPRRWRFYTHPSLEL